MNPSSRTPSPKEWGRLWPASVRWLLLISAYEVDLLQLQLAQGFAGMPRVAGTVRSIILYVRNLSSSDVLMTVNIIQKPAFYGWLQRQLPPTSSLLDCPNYSSIVKLLQTENNFERQWRLFCFVYKHGCHEKIIVKTLYENRIIDKKCQLSYMRVW